MTDAARDAIRIASIPAAHPYVQNLATPDGGERVERLDDPAASGRAPGQWWPPVMLDADWVRGNAGSFDVMHLHFGAESFTGEHLSEFVAALREVGRPLVYTIHDLVNPQLLDQARHLEHLAVLVGAADELITLTHGAADEVEGRYGRRPTVVPHPHVLPLDAEVPAGAPTAPYVIGVNLRDLRPNIDGERIVRCLVEAIGILRGSGIDAVGRVHLREQVRDAESAERIVALITPEDGRVGVPGLELVRTGRLSDHDLADSIAGLDVALLPYSHGTHSGWSELCFDLGVPVAGPDVGFAAEQHPEDFARFDPDDPDSLVGAVLDLVVGRASRPGTPARRALITARRARRRLTLGTIDRAHLDVYESALGRVIA